jgi:hypothetical protein
MRTKKDLYIDYISQNINELDFHVRRELMVRLYNNYDKKYFTDTKHTNKLYVSKELFQVMNMEALEDIFNLIQNK